MRAMNYEDLKAHKREYELLEQTWTNAILLYLQQGEGFKTDCGEVVRWDNEDDWEFYDYKGTIKLSWEGTWSYGGHEYYSFEFPLVDLVPFFELALFEAEVNKEEGDE